MATPNEMLAKSLEQLQKLQKGDRRVIQSRQIKRVDRERLVRLGFLRVVMKGWLISSSPDAQPADSTPWHASFWEFCSLYCTDRFGEDWHLSAEQSLLLHGESSVVPAQVIVCSPGGSNNSVNLPFGTSLFDLKVNEMPPPSDLTEHGGLRIFKSAAALIKVSEAFFVHSPTEAQVALAGIRDASDLLERLLAGGHPAVAGRLSGALRRAGRAEVADEILSTMKAAGYDVRETDPFTREQALGQVRSGVAPIVGRIQAIWSSMRKTVLESFPPPPGLPRNPRAHLRHMDEIYASDAYHSLSIEGYRVSQALVERVRSGDWNPGKNAADSRSRDALAARGYWQAFQKVKATVEKILTGENPGSLLRAAHRDWYRELFGPCVAAGLIEPAMLAGYRNDAVYLRGSRHVPPRWEAVRDAMPALFDLLEHETEPSVRVVLGHWLFVYIHPYPDGNGRIARFLMNAMLASGGYQWILIRVEDRDAYFSALESASIGADIKPFASFIAKRVRQALQAPRSRVSRLTPKPSIIRPGRKLP